MEDTKKIAMKYKIMEILSPIELKNLSFKDLNFVCNLSTQDEHLFFSLRSLFIKIYQKFLQYLSCKIIKVIYRQTLECMNLSTKISYLYFLPTRAVKAMNKLLQCLTLFVSKVLDIVLFTFFYINRRKYCFRANFRFVAFDGFTRFGMS